MTQAKARNAYKCSIHSLLLRPPRKLVETGTMPSLVWDLSTIILNPFRLRLAPLTHLHSMSWILKEDALCISGIFLLCCSLSANFSHFGLSKLSALSPLREAPGLLLGSPSLFLKAVLEGNCRTYLICFLSLLDAACGDAQYLASPCLI